MSIDDLENTPETTSGNTGTEKLTEELEDIIAEQQPATLNTFEVRAANEAYQLDLGMVALDGGSHEILTNDPELLQKFNAEGPAVFDELEGETFELMLLETPQGRLRLSDEHDSMAMMTRIEGSNGVFKITFGDELVAVRSTQPIEGDINVPSAAEDNKLNTFNQPRKMASDKMPSYDVRYGYQYIESVRTIIDTFGLQVQMNQYGQVAEAQMPTPQTLVRLVEQLRAAYESGEGPYVVNIELLDAGKVTNANFVGVFARGNYPIATSELWYYAHDLATDHMVAMLTYGEPLMEMMSQFAQDVQKDGPFEFSQMSEYYPGGQLDGEEKVELAATMLDTLTQHLASIDLQVATEDLELHVVLAPIVETMVRAMQQADTLKDSMVVRYLVDNGIVSTSDEVTTDNFIKGLLNLAREQHGVVQDQPMPKAAPAASSALSNYGGFG